MTTTKYKPQENYAERQHSLGFIRVSAWVPENMRDELLDIAEDMREDFTAAQQAEENAKRLKQNL